MTDKELTIANIFMIILSTISGIGFLFGSSDVTSFIYGFALAVMIAIIIICSKDLIKD